MVESMRRVDFTKVAEAMELVQAAQIAKEARLKEARRIVEEAQAAQALLAAPRGAAREQPQVPPAAGPPELLVAAAGAEVPGVAVGAHEPVEEEKEQRNE